MAGFSDFLNVGVTNELSDNVFRETTTEGDDDPVSEGTELVEEGVPIPTRLAKSNPTAAIPPKIFIIGRNG
jgi:hypothetical protein